jgi:hypothetical protein
LSSWLLQYGGGKIGVSNQSTRAYFPPRWEK